MNSDPSSSSTDSSATALIMLNKVIQRLASQSATCKICSVVLATIAVLFAFGRTGGGSLLWAAAPVILLAIIDAAYTAKAKRLADAALQISRSKGSTDAAKGWELIQLQVVGSGLSVLKGMLALSVWPFYAGLAALVIGLGISVSAPQNQPLPTLQAYPQQMQFMPGQSQSFSNAQLNTNPSQPPRSLPNNSANFAPQASAAPPIFNPNITTRFPNSGSQPSISKPKPQGVIPPTANVPPHPAPTAQRSNTPALPQPQPQTPNGSNSN